MKRVSADALGNWTTELLEAWGYRPEDAAFLADTLVDANLRGIDSHGVMRLPAYYRRVEAGVVRPEARPRVEITGGLVRVDGDGAAGQIAARAAADALARTAREVGVASATVRGSAHFGAAGYYARRLASEGFIAFVVSNSEPLVVPFGGREPLLGTNPFAFAAPAEQFPVCVDMATSTSAMGRIILAAESGTEIPDSWGVDVDGNPTTDPAAVAALLPFGGAKGYGMGMLVEIMAGVLSGASITSDIGHMYQDLTRAQDSGHWMLALDVAQHMPLVDFLTRMSTLIGRARAVAPAPGSSGVKVPGEPEEATLTQRRAEGIPLAQQTVDELQRLGKALQHPFPTT